MNLVQMRERLAAIVSKLGEFSALEMFSDEQLTEVNTLNGEFENLKRNIEAKETLEAITASVTASTKKTSVTAAAPRVEVRASKKEKNGGFESTGEFLMAVKSTGQGNADKRFQNTMFEKNGTEGGFLVPEDMMNEITKKITSDESLLGRTKQFTVSGNALSLPTDEKQPWNGGIQAYWTSEGSPIIRSGAEFGRASWRLNKLAALVPMTDELAEDSRALESYISAMAPEAIMHKINEAILTGNGVGKPQGIVNSDFKITVAPEGGQTADTIVARNVIKMYNRMIPSSRGNAVFYINPQCEDQLRTMTDDNGNFIYLAAGSQMNQSPYAMLLGRPVFPLLGGMQELGTEGDIIFADLSYYYTILKASGMKNAVSTHLLFDRDQSVYKFTMRLDGKCPFKAPVTTQYGNYQMSAFITLADR
tara:strand:- start:3783 stop:5042 length:1260 start_codon:yes stop_codon:yes gene_type:complete